jgi:hypothetical protein
MTRPSAPPEPSMKLWVRITIITSVIATLGGIAGAIIQARFSSAEPPVFVLPAAGPSASPTTKEPVSISPAPETTPPALPTLRITKPAADGKVAYQQDVTVEVDGEVAIGQQVWLLINFARNPLKFFPDGACDVMSETQYVCHAQFADENDHGIGMAVRAILVNSEDSDPFTALVISGSGFPAAASPVKVLTESATVHVTRT